MKHIPDALLITGAGSISAGAWMAWQPAGLLVAGVLMIFAGIKLAGVK